ncbi:MAG: hypothetical protein IT336_04100, partial [Thermomicrobiales bacterium]|nr:hypothetical protein [Thermomicrobiales bacterium]
PVKFDASDTERARELGTRIGAEAVIIYRLDESVEDGPPTYIAYVVFTDPSVELMIGAAPQGDAATALASGEPAAAVQVKEGVDVPVLRTETLNELVNAAAGIIAYEDDRLREAITYLELALPQQPDAANTGLIQFYLGNAYNLNGDGAAGAAALESAAAFYEGRVQAGERLGPQDMLILVKTYTERGRSAQLAGDWETALIWYQKALDLREDLVARASGLEQPSAVPAIYARLFTLMADAYRGLGKTEDQTFWQERAADEIDALVAESDPGDPYPLVRESEARFFLGDCVGALAALDRALALQPDNANALTNVSIISLSQGRPDLTIEALRRIVELRPDDVGARMLLADALMLQAVADGYFEPAYARESEAMFREVIALDPTNEMAYERISGIEELLAQGAMLDTTALVAGDLLTTEKSQVLWRSDPAQQAAVIDALSVMIETRRVLASELDRDDAASQAAVADAYAQRQGFVYGVILARVLPADPAAPVPAASPVAAGDDPIDSALILSDAAEIREWTDRVLADPNASHAATLLAWSARVSSFERVWSWYTFIEPDAAMSATTEQEYRDAVAAAVAFGEAQPVSLDEIPDLRLIYYSAMLLYGVLDGDPEEQLAYFTKIQEMTEREQSERVETTTHLATFCREVQETEAGAVAADAATALPRYEAALSINPSHVTALLGAADAQFALGDVPGAAARAEAATQLMPAQPAGWGKLAVYRLAAGDQAGADAAFAQFLATVPGQRPQERMATIRAAIADLDGLLTSHPEWAPAIVALLGQTAAYLDGMSADGAATYQYPALYAALGRLAIVADAPAAAEPWLRRALELDPYQPMAHADLVIAVTAQGRDAATAIAAASAMAQDPAWALTSSHTLDALLDLMEQEIAAIAGDAALTPFTEAIATARP